MTEIPCSFPASAWQKNGLSSLLSGPDSIVSLSLSMTVTDTTVSMMMLSLKGTK